MKSLNILIITFIACVALDGIALAAGEGTIPLRVTGRVVGSPHERIVSNAQADISRAQQLPSQALHCLAGKRTVRKFLTRGKLTLNQRQTEILAVCIEDKDGDVEIFTQEQSGAIYRVIGKLRKSKK